MATAINALPATDRIKWTGRSGIKSTADGYITLFDNAETAFTGLRFGGSTSAFPMLSRSNTSLQVGLADGTGHLLSITPSSALGVTVVTTGGALKFNAATGVVLFDSNGQVSVRSTTQIGLASSVSVNWTNSSVNGYGATIDLSIMRDAAGILAQRNSTNAQVFRVYNTYNGTNDEWFAVDWQTTANTCTIGPKKTGSGTLRGIKLVGAGITIDEAVDLSAGTTTGTKIGTGTTQKLGFWNATPVVQQVLATGALHTVDDVITFLQTIGLCKQS